MNMHEAGKRSDFDRWLFEESGISAVDYANLHHLVCDRGPGRMGRLLASPERFSADELRSLLKVIDADASDLITRFGLGKAAMTWDELERILQNSGKTLVIDEHAA